jgi:tetratricopeptide (TPR) repeat protein
MQWKRKYKEYGMTFRIFLFIIIYFLFTGSCTKDFDKSIKKAYEYKRTGSRLGVTDIETKEDIANLEKALKEFDKAILASIRATDGKLDTLKMIAKKYTQLKMYLEAAKYLEEARKIAPTDINTLYYLGLNYANYSEYAPDKKEKKIYIKKAENIYSTAINAEKPVASMEVGEIKKYARIYYAYGIFSGIIKGDVQEGIRLLKLSKKRFADLFSITETQKHMRQSEEYIRTLFAIGNLYFRAGNLAQASDQYKEIIEISEPKSAAREQATKNLSQIKSSMFQR